MNEILLSHNLGQVQVRYDAGGFPSVQHRPIQRPGDRFRERFAQHRTTRFADGRQLFGRPATHTALVQLCHQQTVRQQDEVKMPGLALATAQLTIAETKENTEKDSPMKTIDDDNITLKLLPSSQPFRLIQCPMDRCIFDPAFLRRPPYERLGFRRTALRLVWSWLGASQTHHRAARHIFY